MLIYATDSPDTVKAAQDALGREEAGALVEDALATMAAGLRDMGVSRMVVAGGETSGAVVQKLNIGALRIGPEIDPGVPWCVSIGGQKMAVALKSGNFGGPDFFENALASAP